MLLSDEVVETVVLHAQAGCAGDSTYRWRVSLKPKYGDSLHSRSFSIINAAVFFLISRVCTLEFSTTPRREPLDYCAEAPGGNGSVIHL